MSPVTAPAKPKLLDQMREKLRVLHYAWKTEKAYVAWVEKFLRRGGTDAEALRTEFGWHWRSLWAASGDAYRGRALDIPALSPNPALASQSPRQCHPTAHR